LGRFTDNGGSGNGPGGLRNLSREPRNWPRRPKDPVHPGTGQGDLGAGPREPGSPACTHL